jgi:hypothetical protein
MAGTIGIMIFLRKKDKVWKQDFGIKETIVVDASELTDALV